MSSRPRLLFAPLSPRSSASAGLATSRPTRTRQPRAHRTRPAPLQPRRVRLRHRLGSSGSCRIGLGRLLGRARVGSGRRCGWPTCFSARGRRRTANGRSRLHLPPPIIQGLSWPLRLSSLQHIGLPWPLSSSGLSWPPSAMSSFDCARSVWARQAAVQCAGVQACGATSMRRRQASRRRHRRKTRILEDEAKPRKAARNLQITGCNGNPKRLPVHNGR